jgi:hypothetical protein
MTKASDVRVFVPTKNFSVSRDFYQALGWKLNWHDAERSGIERCAQTLWIDSRL